jgi:hypothetical protein
MFGFAVANLIGVCLGFLFGVGCALAVMYSIYMGGYRAALTDLESDPKPKRWHEQWATLRRTQGRYDW